MEIFYRIFIDISFLAFLALLFYFFQRRRLIFLMKKAYQMAKKDLLEISQDYLNSEVTQDKKNIIIKLIHELERIDYPEYLSIEIYKDITYVFDEEELIRKTLEEYKEFILNEKER